MTFSEIVYLIGKKNENLLRHSCSTEVKDQLYLPSPNIIEMGLSDFNYNGQTLRSISALFNAGRHSGSGYLSVLPVDQGVDYSAENCDVPI